MADGKLSLQLYPRSGDAFLSIGFFPVWRQVFDP